MDTVKIIKELKRLKWFGLSNILQERYDNVFDLGQEQIFINNNLATSNALRLTLVKRLVVFNALSKKQCKVVDAYVDQDETLQRIQPAIDKMREYVAELDNTIVKYKCLRVAQRALFIRAQELLKTYIIICTNALKKRE